MAENIRAAPPRCKRFPIFNRWRCAKPSGRQGFQKSLRGAPGGTVSLQNRDDSREVGG
jgi:hypothetical protein